MNILNILNILNIEIKNMAGDIITINTKDLSNILDLKRAYIKECKESKECSDIDEDKLVLFDSNNIELFPNDKRLTKLTDISQLSCFVIPPYIDKKCLRMVNPNDKDLDISYNGDITCIKANISFDQKIVVISEHPLPNDSISCFSIKHEKNEYRSISFSLLDISYKPSINIQFGREENTYSFKYDPFKNKLYYVSKNGFVKSVSTRMTSDSINKYICIKFHTLYSFYDKYNDNTVYLTECTRSEVEKIERNFKD